MGNRLNLSIIIPIYKVEKYIGRCISSILMQECENVDIECILVNDCTPDRSMEIVNNLLNNYHGNIIFRVENHAENSGLSAARNTGLSVAKGDYVFFVDSDDSLQPHSIAYFFENIAKFGEDIDVFLGNSFIRKNGKPAMAFESDDSIIIENDKEAALRKLLTRELYHTAWNKLVRRDFILKHCIYFEKGIVDEDLLWSYLLILNAKKVLVLPRVTYLYEDNPGSILNTTSQKLSLTVRSRIIICNTILQNPPKYSLAEYNMYVFFILTRAINLYERLSNTVPELEKDLYQLRNDFLRRVRKDGYILQYMFFLTSIKPFYYISNLKLYRRFYDKVAKTILSATHFFHTDCLK